MVELAKTSDPVKLSFLRSLLADEGVEFKVFDAGAGSIWPGAIPIRIMVAEKDAWRAREAMKAAGVTAED